MQIIIKLNTTQRMIGGNYNLGSKETMIDFYKALVCRRHSIRPSAILIYREGKQDRFLVYKDLEPALEEYDRNLPTYSIVGWLSLLKYKRTLYCKYDRDTFDPATILATGSITLYPSDEWVRIESELLGDRLMELKFNHELWRWEGVSRDL